ncbi:MAG: hypothetical protein ACRDOL_20110 [Streptosporangiaceae bacterium]
MADVEGEAGAGEPGAELPTAASTMSSASKMLAGGGRAALAMITSGGLGAGRLSLLTAAQGRACAGTDTTVRSDQINLLIFCSSLAASTDILPGDTP